MFYQAHYWCSYFFKCHVYRVETNFILQYQLEFAFFSNLIWTILGAKHLWLGQRWVCLIGVSNFPSEGCFFFFTSKVNLATITSHTSSMIFKLWVRVINFSIYITYSFNLLVTGQKHSVFFFILICFICFYRYGTVLGMKV